MDRLGGFFAVQGLLVLLERSMRGRVSVPTPVRRLGTLGTMLVTAPLFVEPFLQILKV